VLIIGLAILALGWTINLVNFMDGLDGFLATPSPQRLSRPGRYQSLCTGGHWESATFALVLAGALTLFSGEIGPLRVFLWGTAVQSS
jgi:UDP-N-acetylmuramyl pentapeptide phosphotransferase/UDP-N-acetylglucosamine-1-phosphate transferase